VLGVVPGTMGLLHATEVIKVLLGIGDTLAGRLLIYDALDGTFSELKLKRDPHCPACGDGEPVAAASGEVFALGGAIGTPVASTTGTPVASTTGASA
jgi:sulfur-carrier protein adenylyltransferase/sulfurtransferase